MANNQKITPDLESFIQMCRKNTGSLFIKDIPIYINRTPGRLDLMGGNDDYTGGLVFETTIKEATIYAAQPRMDKLFCFTKSICSLHGMAGEN